MTEIGGSTDRAATPGKERVTLNRMNQVYGVGGRKPEEGDWPQLDEDWYLNVPAINGERPCAYPRVDYQDVDFFAMRRAEKVRLQVALDDVEAATGIGPWTLEDEGGTGCGPIDPRTDTGLTMGSAAAFTYMTNGIEASDNKIEQAIDVLEKHYPGLKKPGNIARSGEIDEPRAWDMASDRDDFLAVTYIQESSRVALTFESACFVTLDDIRAPETTSDT